MEKNMEMLSLADALRDGASLEDIRKSFETALQDAQSEVAAEKKAQEAKAKAYEKRGDGDKLDLDECREEMIYVILDYLTALGLIPEDVEIDDDDIDHLITVTKELEEEYKAKLSFMKMLSAMAKMETDKKEKVDKKKVAEKPSADDVIAQFLKGLR